MRMCVSPNITVKSLAADMGVGVGRTLENESLLAKSNVLADIRRRLAKDDRYASNRELTILGMQTALLVLSRAVPKQG